MDYLKAYLYFEDIYTADNLFGYYMDWIIYGQLYPQFEKYTKIPLKTTFVEIDMFPSDIACYKLNGFDPKISMTSPIPYI